MAARKPSSVFVIAENPNSERNHPGMQPTALMAWRIPYDPKTATPEDVAKDLYAHQPIGTSLYVVEDTKGQQFNVGVSLDPVDDPRLEDVAEGQSLGLESKP